MSALTFTLALPGLESLSIGLSRLHTDIADWTSFWKERFAPLFYMRTKQDFILEGGASGASWAPLSPRYAAWKASMFPGKGILVRSGALKASLSGPTAPLAVFRPGTSSLEIGTAVPHAIYHQMGTSRMPQRPPMRADAVFMRQVGKELQKHVHSAWAARRAAFVGELKSSLDQGLPS
jgi:phage gpG-like protein